MCPRCGATYTTSPYKFTCDLCRELLDAEIMIDKVLPLDLNGLKGVGIWRFRPLLPKVSEVVTLREGGTPLIKTNHIRGEVYVKFEGLNPTGSFKDRGMSVGVSIAKSIGAKLIVVASTGNTAASAAAYSARAGIKCVVVLPRGKVARGKLLQAILHGAVIVEVDGSFDRALEYVLHQVSREELKSKVYPLNSFNLWRIEGQKTIAYEIFLDIGVPDHIIVPVGNAGNIYAIWKGFVELKRAGLADRVPRMIGVQAEGASPIARAWMSKLDKPLFTDNPVTIASAIRIGRPINWFRAWRAVKYSNGLFTMVSDDEILRAQKILAREGIAVEPASAASMAAYLKLVEEKVIDPDERVVLIATGHALKDPDVLMRMQMEVYRASSPSDLTALVDRLLRSSES